jgi:hypothetical protein
VGVSALDKNVILQWVRGTNRAIRRVLHKASRSAAILGRSLYWAWIARREMSDAVLTRRLAGHWKSLPGFLEHLAARPGDSWLLPHYSIERVAQLFSDRYPGYVETVIGAADSVCKGEFNLLGHSARYPDGMDWHRDPLSDWRWPVLYRERLDSLVWSPEPPADLTLVWELNRHQHFSYLGIAYWLTRNERYAMAFVSHVNSWIEQNPLQHGIHWHSSMEVALRAIVWTVGFQFFRNSPSLTRTFVATFFKSLYQQVNFVRRHLQIRHSAVPNNHLLAELAALAIVGALFPEFKDAGDWRKTGMELLARHVAQQTHGDGVNKEQASGYHRFVAELLCILVALGRRGLLPRSASLEDTLEKMLDYLLYSTTPTERIPMWGDCGYARVLGMEPGEDYWDAGWMLAVGAVLFKRTDFKQVAGSFGSQAFWLLGEAGLEIWEQLTCRLPERSSRAFPKAGVYVIRDNWGEGGDLMIFRCGPFGLGETGKCSHAHCDLLSPLLWIQGRELLADPGTYTYSGPWRNPFRSTAAHNTLVVDRHDQADPLEPFGWSRIPRADCLEWVEDQRVVGSLLAAPGVRHSRQVIHLAPGAWQIDDCLEGEGSHHLSWNFQFAPDLSLRWNQSSEEIVVKGGGLPFVMILPPAGVTTQSKIGWQSRNHGCKEQASRLEGIWRGEFSGECTVFSWKFIFTGDSLRGEPQ